MAICRPTEQSGIFDHLLDSLGIGSSKETHCTEPQSFFSSSYQRINSEFIQKAAVHLKRSANFISSFSFNRSTSLTVSALGLLGVGALFLARKSPWGAVTALFLSLAGGCSTYRFPIEDDTNCDGKAFQQSFFEVDPKHPDYLSASEKLERTRFIQNGEASIREEIGFSRWQFCHYEGAQYTPYPDPEKEVQGSYSSEDRKIRLLKEASSRTYLHELMHRFSHAYTAVTHDAPLSQQPIWMEDLSCPNGLLASPKECFLTTDNIRTYPPDNAVIQYEERLAYAGAGILAAPLWASLLFYRKPQIVPFIGGGVLGSRMMADISAIQTQRPKVIEVKTDFQVDSGLEVPRIEKEGFSQHKSILLPIGQGVVGFLTHEKTTLVDEEWITLFVPDSRNSTGWEKYNLKPNVRFFLEGDKLAPYAVDFYDNNFVIWAGMGFDLFSTSQPRSNKMAQYIGSYSTNDSYAYEDSDEGKQAIAILSSDTFMILQRNDTGKLSYLLVDSKDPGRPNSISFLYPADFQRDLERAKFVKAIHLPQGKTGWWLGGIEEGPLRKKGILYEMKIPSPLDLARYSSANGIGPVEFKKVKEAYIPTDNTFPRVYEDELYLVTLVKDATYSSNYEKSPNIAMIRLDEGFTPFEWNYELVQGFIPQQGKFVSTRDMKNRISAGDMAVESVVATKSGFTFFNSINLPTFRGNLEDPSLAPFDLFFRFTPRLSSLKK